MKAGTGPGPRLQVTRPWTPGPGDLRDQLGGLGERDAPAARQRDRAGSRHRTAARGPCLGGVPTCVVSASDRCQGFHSPVGVGDGIGKAVGVVATNRCVRRGDPGHGPRPCGQVNDRVQPGLGLGRQRRGGVDLSRRCSNAGDLGEKQDPAVSVAESPDNSLGHRRVYRRLPDFLGPLPTGRIIGFDEGLAQIAATSLDVVQQELTHLAEHRVAQQGPHRAERQALMRRLLEDPEHALHIIVTELDWNSTGSARSSRTGPASIGCCRTTSPLGWRSWPPAASNACSGPCIRRWPSAASSSPL